MTLNVPDIPTSKKDWKQYQITAVIINKGSLFK